MALARLPAYIAIIYVLLLSFLYGQRLAAFELAAFFLLPHAHWGFPRSRPGFPDPRKRDTSTAPLAHLVTLYAHFFPRFLMNAGVSGG